MSEMKISARWGEIDSNGHMRNVAYLDISANCRMEFFNSNGYTLMDFFGAGFGPVVLKDELEYRAEVRLGDVLTVTNELAGVNETNTRFLFRNSFIKDNGKVAATVSSLVMFLDLSTRKKVTPSEGLLAAIMAMPRSENFAPIS